MATVPKCPDPSSIRFAATDVRFVERYASGFSHRSLTTKIGGASNALLVTVLNSALLVEPIPIVKWVMPKGFNDLEHYVEKSQITGIEASSSFGMKSLRVAFIGKDGESHTLELILRKPTEFLAALGYEKAAL